MSSGYRRLAVLVGFVGFAIAFIWAAIAFEDPVGGVIVGAVVGFLGAVASLLYGWTVEGFRSSKTE
jgi:hypothetical protein